MPRVRAPLRHHRTIPKDVPASVPVAALSLRPRSHRIAHVMRNARNAWQPFDTKDNCADHVGRRRPSWGVTRVETKVAVGICRCRRSRSCGGALTPTRSSQRSEEHTSELQTLMRISYAVFCLKKKKKNKTIRHNASKYTT